MPSDPSAFNEGALERFLTSAIATILTIIFSWQIIIDMEQHAEYKKRRMLENKDEEDSPPGGDRRNEKLARRDEPTQNGFNDVSSLFSKDSSLSEKKTDLFDNRTDLSENKLDLTSSSCSSFPMDNMSENRISLSDSEAEFISAMERNDDFAFDEEITLIPSQLPLIHVTPPAERHKRPLEPYQTYFGSDSDSDAECEHMYDANKLCPTDEFYIDYEDSSPSGSDSDVFCRHVLEAISEGDEEDYESSGESEDSEETEPEDDYLENSRDNTSSSEEETEYSLARGRVTLDSKKRPVQLPFRQPLSLHDENIKIAHMGEVTGTVSLHSVTQKGVINNSIVPEINHNNHSMSAPGGAMEKYNETEKYIDHIHVKKQPGTYGKTDYAHIVTGRHSPGHDGDGKSLGNGSHHGIHSNIAFTDDIPDMTSDFSRQQRPGRVECDLRGGDNTGDSNISGPVPFTNIAHGHNHNDQHTEVFSPTPGGSVDRGSLLIDSGGTHEHTSSPLHVDHSRFVHEHSQGLNTIQPSPSSKDHTGIISRSYYLDVKKPSMNRGSKEQQRTGLYSEHPSASSPPLPVQSRLGASGNGCGDSVYTDSELSDGTQVIPRGFTFVRTTEVEEDYKVTSTLLFQPREAGVRLNVCGSTNPSAISGSNAGKHPRVIEVDVLDIGGILGDRQKAKAELGLDDDDEPTQEEGPNEKTWDDLARFGEEITPEHSVNMASSPSYNFDMNVKNPTLDPASVVSHRFEPAHPDSVGVRMLSQPPGVKVPSSGSDSDNESSSTTTGDTAIEINPKLSVVRIGSVDSNDTEEDFVGEILEDDTAGRDKGNSSNEVRKNDPNDVNEDEPVFINLADGVHSPRFKTRRKFQARGNPGQHGDVGQNKARIKAPHQDNSNTDVKNAYNKTRNAPGTDSMKILGSLDRNANQDDNTSSGEESGTNSDSSGSFDCGDSDKSPRGSGRPVHKPALQSLGEIEEELSSESSGDDVVKREQKSDTSTTSSDSEYEDAEESKLSLPHRPQSSRPIGNIWNTPDNIPHTQRSGSNDNINSNIPEVKCDRGTIGSKDTSRPTYINEPVHSRDSTQRPGAGPGQGILPSADHPDYSQKPVSTTTSPFEKNESSSPWPGAEKSGLAQVTPIKDTSITPLNSIDSTAQDSTDSVEGDMYSSGRYGRSSYTSPLYSYTPPAPPKSTLPEYVETGVQTLRSYRQPNICTFSPERYFRPCDVDTTTYSVSTEHAGRVVAEMEYSEKGVQITFDPLWDRDDSLVPSQDELSNRESSSDEASKSMNNIDPEVFRKSQSIELDVAVSIKRDRSPVSSPVLRTTGADKPATSSSSSEPEDKETGEKCIEKETEIMPDQVDVNFTANENFNDNFDMPAFQPEVFEMSPEEVKVSPREDSIKPQSPRGQMPQRPKTPPLFTSSKRIPSVSVGIDIDIDGEEPVTASQVRKTEMQPSRTDAGKGKVDESWNDADDEGGSDSEAEGKPNVRMYDRFSKLRGEKEMHESSVKSEKPRHHEVSPKNTEISIRKPEINLKKPEVSSKKTEIGHKKPEVSSKKPEASHKKPEISTNKHEVSTKTPVVVSPMESEASPNEPKVGSKKPELRKKSEKDKADRDGISKDADNDKKTMALNVTLNSKTRPRSESDKETLKKEYKSVLQAPVDVVPRNISHLITLPEKTMQLDRTEISDARKEYMKNTGEATKSNEEERKALLSKLLGTRDWSDRPKPILKKPSASFREMDDTRKEALSRELSKSRESNVGVYSKDAVKDRISAAVERQKQEDKSKFVRTPLRATVGPIACSRYNEQMMKNNMSKSHTLPAGFGATPNTSKSTDNILKGGGTLPRTFSVVLVRSPSMTLHRTASSFFSDRKSYTNLLETDIDTGEVVERPLVMETDLDEVLRIRKVNMPAKSRSLVDLYSQAGFTSVVKDVYDDTKEPKKWEKTQSLTALTSLSVYNDTGDGGDGEQPELDESGDTERPKTTSEHDIRITKSLTKLHLPEWYKKCPPKPAEEKSPKSPKFPAFTLGDAEVRSRTSSTSSSFSHSVRPVVIQTRVTMPRTSPVNSTPTTPIDQSKFELPSQRFKKNQQVASAYKPIRSTMESLELIRTKSREALADKELKVAERKRVTAEFKLQRWEAPVMKSPEIKKREPEVKIEPETGENRTKLEQEKQKAMQDLAELLVAEEAPIAASSPTVDKRFTSSVSVSLNSAKPPPVPKSHNTSSESELSFVNSRPIQSINDNPDLHFKPVNTSSSSDPDGSFIQNGPNFNRALASSSPGPEQRTNSGTLQFAPVESPRSALNLSNPPDDIDSVSDIESPMQPKPEIQKAVTHSRPAPTIQKFETKVVARPVRAEVQAPMQEPAKVKPTPPVRTSSRTEADRPTTIPKRGGSAMDRLKPQRPAPSRPEGNVTHQPHIIQAETKVASHPTHVDGFKPHRPAPGRPEASVVHQPPGMPVIQAETKVAPRPQRQAPSRPEVNVTHQQPVIKAEIKTVSRPHYVPPTAAPPAPPKAKPAMPVYYQPNTSIDSDTSLTQELSQSYQTAPSCPPRLEKTVEKRERKKEQRSPPTGPKPETAKTPLSLSHPVNTSMESQETPSFRLARAPVSRTNSYRDSTPVDYQGPASPRSSVGYSKPDGTASPRSPTGSYRDPRQDRQGPATPKSPTEQWKPQQDYHTRQGPVSPSTPTRHSEIGHHPNWRPPTDYRRSYQGPLTPAPKATMETDSELSYSITSPDPMSPKRYGPVETDLDSLTIRRLPAKNIIETAIDGDLFEFESPVRKKSHARSHVLETNIDSDLSRSRSSTSSNERDPMPSLPPRRFNKSEPVPDYGPAPSVPPRWGQTSYPPVIKDYGPAPSVPPRRTPDRREGVPKETDIDGDLSFSSTDGSYRTPSQRAPEHQHSQPAYNNTPARYYANVPGSSGNSGYNEQSQGNTGYNNQPKRENASYNYQENQNHPQPNPKSNTQTQLPLYYNNHQQSTSFKAPPIPPRDTTKDVPPPTIHKTDGLFETDIDFYPHNFETIAVEGDVESITPHGTLTRFGRNNKPQPSTQHQSRAVYDFEFEQPLNSVPPTPVTTTETRYTSCAIDQPRPVYSNAKLPPTRDLVPMDAEEDMLFAFVVNKQPKENGAADDDVRMTSPRRSVNAGSLEYGPDSYLAWGKGSDLKVDTNSFRFSKEEERFKCEVGFSNATEQEATLAEVLDGLLALPPSPQANSPKDTYGPADDSSDYGNGFFGAISESGENLLSLSGRGQNIDENRVNVKCRNSKCGKETVLSQARTSYKTCHNCYSYYCCRHCRRQDSSQHKTQCSYNRVTSMCKHVIKKIHQDPEILFRMSKEARAGFLSSGRGCVLFVFQNLLEAEHFVREGLSAMGLEPVYGSMTELEEYYVLGEYRDTVVDMCVDYSPYMKFIVNIAIVMGKETRTNSGPKREGPVIKKCAKLPLSPSLSEPEIDSVTAEQGALILTVGHKDSDLSNLTPHEARDESFDNVQRKLRQRGVCLREQYPDVFNQLVAYVNENQAFSPLTIYPYDGSTGNTFMCVIKPQQEYSETDHGCQITFDTFT